MPSGTGVFTLPCPIINASDMPMGVYTIPLFVFEGYGGLVADFVLPILSITGTGIYSERFGIFQVPLPVISATGLTGALGNGSFVIPKFILSGIYGPRGTGIFVIPILDIRSSPYAIFQLPVLDISGLGTLVPISRIYQGVVMNILNKAISIYANFDFNSLAYFDGKYFGANENGLYLLGGNNDNGIQIQSKIKTGPLNFGNDFIKYIRDIWLTYRSDGHLAVVLLVDEDENNPSGDLITTLASNGVHEERITGPKGMRGRYYTIELKNKSGSDFDLDSINFLVEAIRRKKR